MFRSHLPAATPKGSLGSGRIEGSLVRNLEQNSRNVDETGSAIVGVESFGSLMRSLPVY
jgi:hypothetical protein